MKPGTAKYVPVFTVVVLEVFSYFNCFPDYVRTVCAGVECNFSFKLMLYLVSAHVWLPLTADSPVQCF
jgi:hypothetical protein